MTARAPLHCDSHALGYNKIDLVGETASPFTAPRRVYSPSYAAISLSPILPDLGLNDGERSVECSGERDTIYSELKQIKY